jgi:ADP-heptose:LPS heptosyltransferase
MHQAFSDIHKIAIFRATALGDFIFSLPAIHALHATYPQAELVYLGRGWHPQFLAGRLPGQHRVIAVPPPKQIEQISEGQVIAPEEEGAFFEMMEAEHFDLALQMHGGGEYSNPFIRNCHARHTAGLKSARAVPMERWIPYEYYQNEVVRLLEVAGLTGAAPSLVSLQPSLPVLDSDLRTAEPFLPDPARPFAVIHAGSTDPRRCWVPEKYAQAGDFLAGQGLNVVLTGQGSDASLIHNIISAMHAPVINLCNQLSLPGLVGLIHKAAIFIGNDSGPLHLAYSVGTRAVGLFWVEYILNSVPLFRENFVPVIAWQRNCPQCGKFLDKTEADHPSRPCSHKHSFLGEITVKEVIRAIQEVLVANAPPH